VNTTYAAPRAANAIIASSHAGTFCPSAVVTNLYATNGDAKSTAKSGVLYTYSSLAKSGAPTNPSPPPTTNALAAAAAASPTSVAAPSATVVNATVRATTRGDEETIVVVRGRVVDAPPPSARRHDGRLPAPILILIIIIGPASPRARARAPRAHPPVAHLARASLSTRASLDARPRSTPRTVAFVIFIPRRIESVVMASTQLELARRAHEEIERLDRLASKTLAEAPTTHRARVEQNHRVDCVVTASADAAKRLVRRDRSRA
jgi:hypothetical protein